VRVVLQQAVQYAGKSTQVNNIVALMLIRGASIFSVKLKLPMKNGKSESFATQMYGCA